MMVINQVCSTINGKRSPVCGRVWVTCGGCARNTVHQASVLAYQLAST